jgi:antitoxin ParD1/3/4
MASFNISLSEELKKYVESQIQGGSFGNVSEYFRSLIRDHQKQAAQERLEQLLLEGLQSGNAGPMTKADWDELRQSAAKRAEKRQKEASVKKKSK